MVALGNLLPADSSVDELDSYMYQTVGRHAQQPMQHTLPHRPACRTSSAHICVVGVSLLMPLQVGHQLVSAYATCTGLPLYRRRIQGHSRSQVGRPGTARQRQLRMDTHYPTSSAHVTAAVDSALLNRVGLLEPCAGPEQRGVCTCQHYRAYPTARQQVMRWRTCSCCWPSSR